MKLTLLPIGAHWSLLELKILYDTWLSPLELMEFAEGIGLIIFNISQLHVKMIFQIRLKVGQL